MAVVPVAPVLLIETSDCRSSGSRSTLVTVVTRAPGLTIDSGGCRSIDSGGCRSSGSVAVGPVAPVAVDG